MENLDVERMEWQKYGEVKKPNGKKNGLKVYPIAYLLEPTMETPFSAPAGIVESPSGLKALAERHHLMVSQDRAVAPIIRGRFGLLHEWDDLRLAAYYALDYRTPKRWNQWRKARRSCESVGMEIVLDGEMEGVCTFDPRDEHQVRTAIDVVGCDLRGTMLIGQRAEPKVERVFSPAGGRPSWPDEGMPLAA